MLMEMVDRPTKHSIKLIERVTGEIAHQAAIRTKRRIFEMFLVLRAILNESISLLSVWHTEESHLGTNINESIDGFAASGSRKVCRNSGNRYNGKQT